MFLILAFPPSNHLGYILKISKSTRVYLRQRPVIYWLDSPRPANSIDDPERGGCCCDREAEVAASDQQAGWLDRLSAGAFSTALPGRVAIAVIWNVSRFRLLSR